MNYLLKMWRVNRKNEVTNIKSHHCRLSNLENMKKNDDCSDLVA